MEEQLVSIVVLSYKNLQYIKNTLDSILIQDYKNIELIIGDDGSENFDSEIYKDYINKKNLGNIKNIIIYSNEKNLGTVKNANKAISLCKGEYIKFIAADDEFYSKDIISKMVEYMYKNNSIILMTNILWCDSKMNELDDAKQKIERNKKNLTLGKESKVFFKKLAQYCYIQAPGVMFKKYLFDKYGEFDEDYILIEDWNTWLRLTRKGVRFDYLDIVSVKYRVGTGVSTSNEPNPLFVQDYIKCIEKEILPDRKELGSRLHKNINYVFVRTYKFKEYKMVDKVLFIFKNIDIVCINQINKILLKLKRNNQNEN